jgi:hypothetical protein
MWKQNSVRKLKSLIESLHSITDSTLDYGSRDVGSIPTEGTNLHICQNGY